MDEMMEQVLSHVKYYLSFYYDHGSVVGDASVNLSDVDKLTVDYFKKHIQASRGNNVDYNVEICLEYPTSRAVNPYEVEMLNESLFSYDTNYDEIKDKTIGQCVLETLDSVKTDRYSEVAVAAIERLKEYLNSNTHQMNR